MAADLALRSKFRKTVEEKLHIVATNNPTVIVSAEISPSLDAVSLVCHEQAFNERVVNHLAVSLVRLLGVGQRLLIVDRTVTTMTIQCVPTTGGSVFFRRTYPL